ncbi:MAG: hypothetical protein D6814_16330 [Calditrichaeota bacterium]|nr:MAG: hypothetical protein D6814_16330 [Calditrichota bacterium]
MHKKPEIIDVVSYFLKVRTLLILMPEKVEDFGLALKKLEALKKQFPKSKFMSVIRHNFSTFVSKEQFETVYVLGPRDLTLFGLPRRSFLKNLLGSPYDLVIDFNNDFDIATTYLCSRIDGKLKVCLSHPYREPFYNLQIRTKNSDSLDKKFNTLLKYLSILAQPSPQARKNLIPA